MFTPDTAGIAWSRSGCPGGTVLLIVDHIFAPLMKTLRYQQFERRSYELL